MKINLKKSASLQSQIKALIDSEYIANATVELNKFTEEPAKIINSNKIKLSVRFADDISLTDVLFEIRQLTDVANFNSGVNILLNKIELVKSKIKLIKDFLENNDQPIMSTKEIIDRVMDLKTSTDRYDNNFRVYCFTDEELQGYNFNEATLKKELSQLKDKLLYLNVSTEIELSDEIVKTLSRANLV